MLPPSRIRNKVQEVDRESGAGLRRGDVILWAELSKGLYSHDRLLPLLNDVSSHSQT